MSRRDWSALNFLEYNATPSVTAAPLSMACWGKSSVASGGVGQSIFGLFTSGSAVNRNRILLAVDNAGSISFNIADGAGTTPATSSTTITADTWFHACGTYASATAYAVYLNGAGKGTGSTSRVPSGINRVCVGIADALTTGVPFAPAGTGDICWCAIWNIDLSDTDAASLADGVHPFMVRPDKLLDFWPIFGRNSPENNVKNNTRVLTITGTLSQSAQTRVFMPRMPNLVHRASIPLVSRAGFDMDRRIQWNEGRRVPYAF